MPPRTTRYGVAEPVGVTWSNAPGNRWDWLGIFKATDAAVPTDGSIPDDSGDYLLYEYTRTEVEGHGTFSKSSQTGSGTWPLPPGRYEVRLMLDDGYRTVARSRPFTIEASSTLPGSSTSASAVAARQQSWKVLYSGAGANRSTSGSRKSQTTPCS